MPVNDLVTINEVICELVARQRLQIEGRTIDHD